MNSTGSYSANLSAGSETCPLSCPMHGDVSTTMGSFPPSLAAMSAASRSELMEEAASLKPRLRGREVEMSQGEARGGGRAGKTDKSQEGVENLS